jgi:hypothetical protein
LAVLQNTTELPNRCRLLPSGTVDTDFVIGLGASGVVEEVQIQPDGKIIL